MDNKPAENRYDRFYPNDSTVLPGMNVIMSNNTGAGMVDYVPDIEFAAPDGKPLKLQLLLPRDRAVRRPCPLVVFVQGSSWTNPNPYWEIPQLSLYAKRGFAVASVTHRSSRDAAFPACLIDVKSAIRFLRMKAADYSLDPERVAIWGTSSGGNIALLTATTAGMPEFEQGDNLEYTSSVQAVVDFFGPSDVNRMVDLMGFKLPDLAGLPKPEDNPLYTLIGGVEGDAKGRMAKVAPAYYFKHSVKLPPHLFIHGDCDNVVPFSQSVEYYTALRERGVPAEFYKVSGAAHEDRFWSDEILEIVYKFLLAYLV